MVDEYIAMRKSGQLDLVWFYKFYIQEFAKLSPTCLVPKKDNFGQSYMEPIHSGEGVDVFRYQVIEIERTQADFQQFAQSFGLALSMFPDSILEHCDRAMGVCKIEERTVEKWVLDKKTESKLFYIS